MKNPKPENRDPKFGTAPCAVRSVLECGRARGASGNRSADFRHGARTWVTVECIDTGYSPRVGFGVFCGHAVEHSLAVGGAAALALGFLCSLLCLPALAQYAIDWHTMDGGGGTSTGAVYAVSGTIGQPDASPPAHAGGYTLVGGFWALPQLVQTPGAPTLYVTNAATGWATLWWTPATGTNWVLQERLNLTSGAWTNSPAARPTPSPSRPRCRRSSIGC